MTKNGGAANMIRAKKTLALGSEERRDDAVVVWDLIRPERRSLDKLKRISIRNKSWFGVLTWGQRRFIEAVMKVVERIRSPLLLRLLAPLVMKLLSAAGKGDATMGAFTLMGKTAYRLMRNVAQKISSIAQRWGNNIAQKWVEDAGFIKYLMMMSLPQNKNPPTFAIPN